MCHHKDTPPRTQPGVSLEQACRMPAGWHFISPFLSCSEGASTRFSRTEFKSKLYHLLALWPWVRRLSSLIFMSSPVNREVGLYLPRSSLLNNKLNLTTHSVKCTVLGPKHTMYKTDKVSGLCAHVLRGKQIGNRTK